MLPNDAVYNNGQHLEMQDSVKSNTISSWISVWNLFLSNGAVVRNRWATFPWHCQYRHVLIFTYMLYFVYSPSSKFWSRWQ